MGHELTNEGITISDDNVKAIKNIAVPKNKRSLQRLLGLLNYFRKYIKNYSLRTTHMRALLKKEIIFKWTEECTKELEDLQTALISKPIIGPIDENKDIYVTVDGSKMGLGGHIFQKHCNGKIYTYAYYSCATTKSQHNWPSYALEMQALAMTLRHFEYILLHKRINVFSDNAVVVDLAKYRPVNAREARLIAYLTQFQLNIRHVAGIRNCTADFLSRMCEDLYNEKIEQMRQPQNLINEEFILPISDAQDATSTSVTKGLHDAVTSQGDKFQGIWTVYDVRFGPMRREARSNIVNSDQPLSTLNLQECRRYDPVENTVRALDDQSELFYAQTQYAYTKPSDKQ